VSSVWLEQFGRNSRGPVDLRHQRRRELRINVIYSGTYAIEASWGPSVAISLRMGRGRPRFDLAAARARHVLEKVLDAKALRPYEILSINIPTTEEAPVGAGVQSPELAGVARHDPSAKDPGTMPPIRVCPMNVHGLIDKYERRVSPMGDVYYWAAGHGLDFHATELGSDVDLLLQGCITVTPLTFDLTQHATVEAWRERLEG
jgi:5'/3'-nucleotidase SurE